jgi:phosphoesterase RecJ-like protein
VLDSNTVGLIRELLQQATQVLVVTHIAPDGDAVGSLTGTGLALLSLEKYVTLVCDDGLPNRFKYLPLADQVYQQPANDEKYDLIIALDAGDPSRLGSVLAGISYPVPPLINIDHHVTNTRYGQVNLVGLEACSTTEILFELFPELGVPLTADLARCLLTGLVTDTLSFRTANVTAKTLKVAGALVDAGADLYTVTTQALSLKELSTLFIWQKGLNKAQVEDGLIWTAISNEEREEVEHHGNSTYGLGNLLADVFRVKMSVVMLEMADGRVNVGFRCHPPYSVSELARELGGGGHHLAAGCTIEGSLKDVQALVVSKSKEALRQQTTLHNSGA